MAKRGGGIEVEQDKVYELRDAVESDAEAMRDIALKIGRAALSASTGADPEKQAGLSRVEEKFDASRFAASIAQKRAKAAVLDGQVVGFALLNTAYARLEFLMVDPKHRDRGLGERLLAWAEDEIEGRYATLAAMSFFSGMGFFAKQGYKKIGDYMLMVEPKLCVEYALMYKPLGAFGRGSAALTEAGREIARKKQKAGDDGLAGAGKGVESAEGRRFSDAG